MSQSQKACIDPALLVWARESIGLDQDSAAKLLDIDLQVLVEWESGTELPTIARLRDASRVYKRPLAVFFLPKPPTDFDVPHDYRRGAGTKRRKLSPELRSEIRRVQFLREVAFEVAEFISDEPGRFLGRAKVTSNVEQLASSMRELLSVAVGAQRQEWDSAHEALKSWRAALEEIGILVFQIQGVETSEFRGFSIRELQFPIIAINAKDAAAARIFTMLHELGHLLLDQGGLCDLVDDDRRITEDERVEIFCNVFAGELLVPREDLLRRIGVSSFPRPRRWTDGELVQLSRSFSVSREVIVRRLLTIGGATHEFYLEKRKEYHSDALDRPDRQTGGPSPATRSFWNVGGEFARIVIDAHDRDAISPSALSEYLGVKAKHFEEVRELAFEVAGSAELPS